MVNSVSLASVSTGEPGVPAACAGATAKCAGAAGNRATRGNPHDNAAPRTDASGIVAAAAKEIRPPRDLERKAGKKAALLD
jgi:hypothetical protein